MNCKKVYEDLGHRPLQYLADGVPMELQLPNNISQTCKGVKKAVRHTIKLDLYRDVLLRGATAPRIQIPSLMSRHHQIYMIDRAKVSINPFDSKRYWLNAVESVPFGHYSISDWVEPVAEGEQACTFRFSSMMASKRRRENEELASVDDAPMARVRAIEKRRREEAARVAAEMPSTSTAAPTIAGLPLRENRPRGMLLSMDEFRSLRERMP